MPTLNELYGLDAPVAPAAPADQSGQFASGFKRSFADLPGLAAGVGGFAADALGANDTRDKLLAYAKTANDQEAKDHAGDAASITDAWDGKTSWPDFLKNAAGYTAGQALQSVLTGGVGSIGMRALAKTGAAKLAEAAAAKAILAGASEDAAKTAAAAAATEALKKAGIQGAAAGAGAHNFGMELGSIYPDAADQAQKEGRSLDGGDLARVLVGAGGAALVDTGAEAIMAGKILRGSGAGGGLLRRAATEIPAGMAREAGTEAAQTAIEHYGAGQPIADAAGIRDIIDSAGIGAVGGGLGGGLAATHAHAQPAAPVVEQPPVAPAPPPGPTEKAIDTNAPLDANGFHWTPPAAAEPGIAPPAQGGGLAYEADPRFATSPTYGAGQAPPPQQVYGTQQAAAMAIGEQGLVGTHDAVAIGPNAWEIRPNAAPDLKMIAPGIYEAPTPGDSIRAQRVPEIGPLSRATNIGLESGAQHADADADAAKIVAQQPPAPAPLAPQHEASLLDFANQRAAQLETKVAGVKEKKTLGPDGKPVVTPEVPKQFLTPTEQAEQQFLAEHGGNAQALATHYTAAPAEKALGQTVDAAVDTPAPAAELAQTEHPTITGPNGDQRAVFPSEEAATAYLTDARRGRSTPLIASIKPIQRDDGTWTLATADEIEALKTYETKLNPQGKPFAHMGQAKAVAKKIGGEPVKVEGGFGVRQEAPKMAAEGLTMADARKKWKGLANAPDEHVRTQEAWDRANQALVRETGNHDAGNAIHDKLVEEWGEKRIAKDQAGFSKEETKRLAEELAARVKDRKTEGTLANRRQEKQDTARRAESEAFMDKAAKQEVEFEIQRLAKLHDQGRLSDADAPAIQSAIHASDTIDQAEALHQFNNSKEVAKSAGKVAGKGRAANEPAPKKRPAGAQKAADLRAAKLADYFAPGNIVKSYFGHDVVLSHTPAAEGRGFSVKVHAVTKVGDAWVVDPKANDRTHATAPDAKELVAGPVQRAAAPETKAEPESVKKAADEEPLPFSRSKETSEAHALKALSENDDLFALPKSDKDTVEGIVADTALQITVKKSNMPGPARYVFTLPDGTKADMTVRDKNPYGPSVYDLTMKDGEAGNLQTERPGENPEDVDPDKGDVWIDVSALKRGGSGAAIYNIAATYAHNTGRIFIGDPVGLSNDALVRRSEQMLSSALKFGTTEHLAPSQRQVEGDKKVGVPPLKWVYGDDRGNIRRLIDLNLKVQENQSQDVRFDPSNGNFLDASGRVLDRAELAVLAHQEGKYLRAGGGGNTLARSAIWRALLREEGGSGKGAVGGRDDLLARLAKLANDAPLATKDVFYSRGEGSVEATPAQAARAAAVEHFAGRITSHWENAPAVVVVNGMDDPRIPAAVRAEDAKQKSQGASGEPEGFYQGGTVYLVANQLPGDRDVLRVLMHESLGHFGLRSVFGKELATILDRMAVLNQGKVRDKARAYGLDMDKLTDRRAAAEEVLAEMAQTNPKLGWVQRAIAAIRSWLRDNVPGFDKMKFSDDELVRNFIEPARNWVKNGKGGETQTFQRAQGAPAPMFSRSLGAALMDGGSALRDVALPAGYKVGDLLNDSGKLSWWHKTFGTPFNLAQRHPKFGRVYDGVQRFLSDTSYYANEAMNQAQDILPKLEDWKDIARSPLPAEDTKALAAPVFEGTLSWTRGEDGKPVKVSDLIAKAEGISVEDKAHELLRRSLIDPNVLRMWQGRQKDEYEQMIGQRYESQTLKAGIVFKPAELKSMFGLNDKQVKLYQQTRGAIDNSLTSMAVSHMLRLAGDDATELAEKAMDANDVNKAAEMLRDHLFAQAAAIPERADELNDTGNRMIDIADQAKSLMDKGYAPLSRFGSYTLDVVSPEGDRLYFGLFESSTERSKMARQMRANHPDAKIQLGTVSKEEYKQFQGISPETLSIFGEMLGLGDESTDPQQKAAFQEYIKRGISSRSALKRLIERKGIAGFSEDVGRVLAGFIVSNARNTSSNLHMKEIDRATTEVDQNPDGSRTGQGELKDAAVNLVSYIKNPVEEAPAARGLLVTQYLGGNVASAMMNATQPLTTTLPYLSQFAGAAGAAKALVQAAKYANKNLTGDTELDAALKRASEEGIVSPQEIHNLMAQASGRAVLKSGDGTTAGNAMATASNVMSKTLLAWGKVFSVAEQFNRRLTFIAAFKIAQEKGMENPAAFAAKAVHATQFVQNRANRPQWARGAIGATLFTFRSYSISYIELLQRMATAGEPGSPERAAGRRGALLALAVLFMMAGSDGLPFADDIGDLIDGALQRLGYNVTTKEAKRRFFAGLVGEGGAQFISKGLSGLPGAPIDISGRSSMGNLIPGTGLLTRKPDHTSDVAELFGPAGDFVKRAAGSIDSLTRGELASAAAGVAPTAIQNMGKAYVMATKGEYEDSRGAKVIDTDAMDAVAKAFGFQPNDVSKVQNAKSEEYRYRGLQTLRTQEIAAKWATGLATADPSLVQQAKAERDSWNEKNPTRITINMPSLLRAVREMKKTAAQRLEDSSPKGLRNKIRSDFARETQ